MMIMVKVMIQSKFWLRGQSGGELLIGISSSTLPIAMLSFERTAPGAAFFLFLLGFAFKRFATVCIGAILGKTQSVG